MSKLRKSAPRLALARRIRAQRESLSLTKDQVAKQLRLDRQQWYRIERGVVSIPAERLVEVAMVLITTPNALLGFP